MMDLIKPSDHDAENAIRILIKWLGDDPDREHLINTPKRLLNFYKTFFKGYHSSAEDIVKDSVFANENYKDMIVLENINFLSHCEHHIVPISGKANIAYIPDKFIIGINAIIKLVNVFTRRLQLQERLTTEIANSLNTNLKPKGVAVVINATHSCVMCNNNDLYDNNVVLNTTHMLGIFKNDVTVREEFFLRIKSCNNYRGIS